MKYDQVEVQESRKRNRELKTNSPSSSKKKSNCRRRWKTSMG